MKKIYLTAPKTIGTISPEIYGHFSEHIGGVFYDGLWVGKDSEIPNIKGFRKDLVEKLKAIKPPVLRWPGGCFAEIYNWRDGIGENRPTRISWWTRNDGRYETNAVGTHEFCDLCELIGAKPYIAANLTSMTPLDIRDWMDYCMSPRGTTTLALEREKNGHPEPFNIPYWGVGNENWGGGGNMRPEFYADECRRYATIMNNAFPDTKLFVCGSDATAYRWTHKVSEGLAGQKHYLNGFAMHYYCGSSGGAVDFNGEDWKILLRKAQVMEEIIRRNWNIISSHNLEDKIKLVVDEWGCWHSNGSGPTNGYNLFEQQSTMRDAVVAAMTLNIFNNHCEKVVMANVAQLVNNLHALFLANKGNCITTPTYHIFDMYKKHQGATAIQTIVTENEDFDNSVSVSASVKNNELFVTAANISCEEDTEFTLENIGIKTEKIGHAVLLSNINIHAHNTFENPDNVSPVEYDTETDKAISLPKASVMALTVKVR